jgi:hypothetical protein|tara:strand:- start:436 stop:561 length:126 start_codon:yes stop_codon:yes gene_type:complete
MASDMAQPLPNPRLDAQTIALRPDKPKSMIDPPLFIIDIAG